MRSRGGIIVFVIFACVLVMSLAVWKLSRPRYCPLIAWDTNCKILDSDGQRVLVQYFNADANILEFSVFRGTEETPILSPRGHVSVFYDSLSRNQISFDRADEKYLLVNGQKFYIEPLNGKKKV